MLPKTILAFIVASAVCAGVQAQVEPATSQPYPAGVLASEGSRTVEFGVGILQNDQVHVLVEGQLQFVVPMAELEVFEFHGIPTSFIMSQGKTTWFHIIVKEILQ